MEVKNLENQKGFTLVEIAIVLVIIGLLLGGVLKGQELINSAKIKSDTDTLVSLQAATYAFQDRIGELPGEGTATTVTTTAVANQIPTTNSGTAEADNFFADLNAQGFISSTTLNSEFITSAYFIVGYGAAAASTTTGLAIPTRNQICLLTTADIAGGIDTKLDDGTSNTGTVHIVTLGTPVGDATDSVCLEI